MAGSLLKTTLAAEHHRQSLARRWRIVSGPAPIRSASASETTPGHRTRSLASSPTSVAGRLVNSTVLYSTRLHRQRKLTGLSFVLRTNGNLPASVSAVREAARSLDKDAFVSAEPLEENVSRMLEPARTGAWFSGTVSLLALLIAATGIYGMLSYHVVERTSEIGIRMALGAQRRNVLLLIVGDGMKLAAIGTAIGVAAAIALTKVMTSLSVRCRAGGCIHVCNRLNRRTRCRVTRLLTSRPGARQRSIPWLHFVTNNYSAHKKAQKHKID